MYENFSKPNKKLKDVDWGDFLKSMGWLDAPYDSEKVSDCFTIYGWYLCESDVSKIEILLDDKVIGEAYYGDFREGFDILFPEYNKVNAGFNFIWNTLCVENGEHTLDIRVLEHSGSTNYLKQTKVIVNNLIFESNLKNDEYESSSFWKHIIENQERNNDTRFSYDWYRGHIITKELLSSKINFGQTLEIASGIGKRAILLHEKTNTPIIGIDSDEFAIDYSNRCVEEYFGKNKSDVHFIKSSFYDLPFSDNTFDSGIFIAGLEHALYPIRVMDEIQRVIKPNGYLFLTVTKENFHADPTHVSNWSSKSIVKFMSNYGECKIKCIDNIFFVTLQFKKLDYITQLSKVVYCDLNIRDTYTPNWIKSFQLKCDLNMVSLQDTNVHADEELINKILDQCDGADLFHLGTGANFSNIDIVLDKVRYQYPEITISKWYGDVDEVRYINEVYNPSNNIDMVFLASGNFIGKIKPHCGQIHINGVYDQEQCEFVDWDKKDIDVLIIANAYSEERLSNIKSFIPDNTNINTVWIGDGSPNGRVSRQDTFDFYKRAKIVYNIVDNQYGKSTFWVSTRVYLAMSCGCLVFTSQLPHIDTLFEGGIIQLQNKKEDWQSAAHRWLYETDKNQIKEIVDKNYTQITRYHSFDYKVKSILFHNGLGKNLDKS